MPEQLQISAVSKPVFVKLIISSLKTIFLFWKTMKNILTQNKFIFGHRPLLEYVFKSSIEKPFCEAALQIKIGLCHSWINTLSQYR